MPSPVRILHFDDNALDAQLIALTLDAEREELPSLVTYVQTKEAYLSALDRKDFDIILSDYRMPAYDGDQALAAALENCPEIPFIMVTGELGEERAIETLQRGAADYVLKNRLVRLVPAIQRALDVAELKRSQKRAEEALRQSRETLALAVKATNLGLFDYYPNDDLLLWNEQAKEHFGLPPDASVSYELFLRGIHPDDRERVQAALQEVLTPGSNGSCQFEYRAIGLLDQKERWLDSRGQVFVNEHGVPVRFIGTTNDITSKKRVEEALQVHEETMEAFFEASPALLNIFDEQLHFIHTDRVTPTYYGLDRQSIVGQSLMSLNPELAIGFVKPIMTRVLANEEPEINVEVSGPVPSRKGSQAFWQISFFPVSLPGKRQGLGVIGIETTELKVAQQRLQQLQDLYRVLVEQQTDLVVKISRQGRYLYANQNFLDTIGKTETEVLDLGFVPEIHPDDLACVEEKWIGMFEPPDYRSSIEARMMTVLGWRWISWRNNAVFDSEGEASTAICVGRDVTERRQAEEELARREARFRSLISSSSEAIALVDEHGILLAISQSGAEILGSPASELVNSDVHHFVPPTHLDTVAKSLLRLTARPDTPQFVLMRLQTDKKPNVWVELEATAVTSGEEIQAYFFRLRPVLLGE